MDDFVQEADTWLDVMGDGSIIYVDYKPTNETKETSVFSYVNE